MSEESRKGQASCGHCGSNLITNRCDQCGTWADVNFLGKSKISVGIHPALAKRYAASHETSSSKLNLKKTVEGVAPTIPGYELLDRVGKGAMGSVYRAKHMATSNIAAVKILSAQMSSRADLVARFERESAALSTLRHPNIVTIYEVGSASNVHYFSMAYIEGITLRQFLRNGPVSLKTAVNFMKQILAGLTAAHKRGVIHRDLKPENVLVEQAPGTALPLAGEGISCRLVLVDFGLAGLLSESNPHPNLTRSQVTMGTVNYMAPEQHVDAKRVDHRCDVYSAGVIFYESILGELPLGRFALPSERRFEAPLMLDEILSKALSREPEKRYQSAKEFSDALSALEDKLQGQQADFRLGAKELQQESSLSENPTIWASSPPWVKKPVAPIGLAALVLGLILGIALSKQHPREVVVTAKGADAIYNGTQLEALGKTWKSESPVWEAGKSQLRYQGRQGKGGHFRRDMSLLIEQDKYEGDDFGAILEMEHLKLPMSTAKIQHFASERLGVIPGSGAGGVFYVSADGYRVIGVQAYLDGGCMVVEYKKQDGTLKRVQQLEMPCARKELALRATLSKQTGRLEAFNKDKLLASLDVKNLAGEKWQRALGCRNLNCSFDSIKPD